MRFAGDGDENFPGEWFLWESAQRRCFAGQPGQQRLRELRDALLALPEKRLITTRLANEQGEFCAIGALARHQAIQAGDDPAEVLERLASYVKAESAWDDPWETEDRTISVAQACGMKRTMAAAVAYENDLDWGREVKTPEQRYQAMLRWVESCIIKDSP